jgi:hypothetical protein
MPNGYAPEEIEIVGRRSDEIEGIPTGVFVADWEKVLPSGLPLGFSMLLRGRPGGGKSRAAFRFVSQLGTTMAFALEMGQALSCVTAEVAGARMDRFYWYDSIAGLEELDTIDPAAVAIDSVQKLGRDKSKVIKRLRRWALERQRNLVLVSQQNIRGASWGGDAPDFDCDFIVDISRRLNEKGIARREIHGNDETPSMCAEKCAHAQVAKTRVPDSVPVAFDVPIVR